MTARLTGYGVGGAKIDLAPVPTTNNGVPTSNTAYDIGQLIKNTATGSWYLYSGASTFLLLASSSGTIVSVLGTANQITVTTVAGVATISLPSAITTPGSLTTTTTLAAGTSLSAGTTITAGTGITSTTGNIVATAGAVTAGTTMTAGTGITSTTGNIVATAGAVNAGTSMTATSGNITATSGNFVAVAAGTGLSLPVTTNSGAASGTVNCNGRVGSVSFTSPSIAAGATQTLTVGNTAVTGSSTVVLYSLRGATTGAALNIQSVTNSSGSSAVVVENGTGATTQTGTITLDFIVLN